MSKRNNQEIPNFYGLQKPEIDPDETPEKIDRRTKRTIKNRFARAIKNGEIPEIRLDKKDRIYDVEILRGEKKELFVTLRVTVNRHVHPLIAHSRKSNIFEMQCYTVAIRPSTYAYSVIDLGTINE